MIRIQAEDGNLARLIDGEDEPISFFETYGFVTTSHLQGRQNLRRGAGHLIHEEPAVFGFSLDSKGSGAELSATGPCEVHKIEANRWRLQTPTGLFIVDRLDVINDASPVITPPAIEKRNSKWPILIPAVVALIIVSALVYRLLKTSDDQKVAETPVPPPIVVVPTEQRVTVAPEKVQETPKNQAIDKKAKIQKALTQNLGFLKLMGRKDLKKAMGGLPTQSLDASPGAGPGGKEGSGGEILVGLGQGLRKTTVGNSGMKGLGGIGTKGAGGGLGGYGETDLGSGAGQSISAIPLARDAVIDGGLDRSLIQATIMRYLSQVRACYENGLKRKPEMIGQVTMNFEIAGSGMLNYSRVQRSSLEDRDVESCISTRMMTWKFPLPRGGVNVRVSYPFMLRPVNS